MIKLWTKAPATLTKPQSQLLVRRIFLFVVTQTGILNLVCPLTPVSGCAATYTNKHVGRAGGQIEHAIDDFGPASGQVEHAVLQVVRPDFERAGSPPPSSKRSQLAISPQQAPSGLHSTSPAPKAPFHSLKGFMSETNFGKTDRDWRRLQV